MPRYYLKAELDDKPTYIFDGETPAGNAAGFAANEPAPVVTIAPGYRAVAGAILSMLNDDLIGL